MTNTDNAIILANQLEEKGQQAVTKIQELVMVVEEFRELRKLLHSLINTPEDGWDNLYKLFQQRISECAPYFKGNPESGPDGTTEDLSEKWN